MFGNVLGTNNLFGQMMQGYQVPQQKQQTLAIDNVPCSITQPEQKSSQPADLQDQNEQAKHKLKKSKHSQKQSKRSASKDQSNKRSDRSNK